jgi:hypothetical protein
MHRKRGLGCVFDMKTAGIMSREEKDSSITITKWNIKEGEENSGEGSY